MYNYIYIAEIIHLTISIIYFYFFVSKKEKPPPLYLLSMIVINENNVVFNVTKDEILERRSGASKKPLRKAVMELRSTQGDDLKE